MIKYVILAFILFLAYRIFSEKPRIGESRPKGYDDQDSEDTDYTDYEEID